MEWLHIVVITLIYVHPKTVTWAKECEIPDYAYSEKRRKNQYGDELNCLDQDLEPDNALYHSKLVSINTRKKLKGLKDENYHEDYDCRVSDTNNYIPSILLPPTNQSIFHKLLNQYQPNGCGPYINDTQKSVLNIYPIKSQDYDDKVKEIKLPLMNINREDTNQIHSETDTAKLTNSSMDVHSRQANYINQNMSDQKEGLQISENSQTTKLPKVTEPLWSNQLNNTGMYSNPNLQNTEKSTENEILYKIEGKSFNNFTNGSHYLEVDENKKQQLFNNMANKIINSQNITERTNLDKQNLVNEKKNQSNEINGANTIKQGNSNYLLKKTMIYDAKGPVVSHNKGKTTKYSKQQKVHSRMEGTTLNKVRNINFGKLSNKILNNRINQTNKEINTKRGDNDLINQLDESEDHMDDNVVHPERTYKKLKEISISNEDLINTNIPTNLKGNVQAPKNMFNPKSNAVNQEQMSAVLPRRQKLKNGGWSLFHKKMIEYNSETQDGHSTDVPIDNYVDSNNVLNDESKHKKKIKIKQTGNAASNKVFNNLSNQRQDTNINYNWNATGNKDFNSLYNQGPDTKINYNWNATGNKDFNNLYNQGPDTNKQINDNWSAASNNDFNNLYNHGPDTNIKINKNWNAANNKDLNSLYKLRLDTNKVNGNWNAASNVDLNHLYNKKPDAHNKINENCNVANSEDLDHLYKQGLGANNKVNGNGNSANNEYLNSFYKQGLDTNNKINENLIDANNHNFFQQEPGKELQDQKYLEPNFIEDPLGIYTNQNGNDKIFNTENSNNDENNPVNNFELYNIDGQKENVNKSKIFGDNEEQTYNKFNGEDIIKKEGTHYKLKGKNGMYQVQPWKKVKEPRKRVKREEKNAEPENNSTDKQEPPVTVVNSEGDASSSTVMYDLPNHKQQDHSPIGEFEVKEEINPNSNKAVLETLEGTIQVNSKEEKPKEVKNITNQTSTLKKIYKKINFFRTSNSKLKSRLMTTTELKTETVTQEQPIDLKSKETSENIENRDIRTVTKMIRGNELDKQFKKQWMEVKKSFTNYLGNQRVPKFPQLKLIENDSIPQLPTEIKAKENFNMVPFPIEEADNEMKNVSLPLNNDAIFKMNLMDLPIENSAFGKRNNVTHSPEIILGQNKKREIHCCFKLNDGQHSNDHEDQQLKQIELKIKNKKLTGCPLKETSIEMTLTKDKVNQGQENKWANHSSHNFNDEMQPFQIDMKNYTHDDSQKTTIQGMNDFNKLYSLTKLNKNTDKWEKQIKKLYEIINEEKRGEERNKTTYSSLHKMTDKEQESMKPTQTLQVFNGSIAKDQSDNNLEDELLISQPMNKLNHLLFNNNCVRNMDNEKIQKLQKDEKSYKILVNHLAKKLHPELNKKEETALLGENEKNSYQKGASKYKNGINKHTFNNSKNPQKEYYVDGIRVDGPIKAFVPTVKTVTRNFPTKKFDQISLQISNNEIKTKLRKKCENLKSNISSILNMMPELQNESKNKQQRNSYMQYTGFNTLLNNLKKFNRQSSCDLQNGKDIGDILSKLRLGTMNFKDGDIKNEVSSPKNRESLSGDEINRAKSSENKILADTIDIKLTVPTIVSGEETQINKELGRNATRSFEISSKGNITSDILPTNTSEDIQDITTNAGIILNSSELKNNYAPNETRVDTDKTTYTGLEDKTNGKNKTNQLLQTMNGSEKRLKTLIYKNFDNVSNKITDISKENSMYNYLDMHLESTSKKMSEVCSERKQHSPYKNCLASVSGKNIIKLVQKDITNFSFEKFNKTSISSDTNEETDTSKTRIEPEPLFIKIAPVPSNYSDSNVERGNIRKLWSDNCLTRSNSASIFDTKNITKIAKNFQTIPQKLTMPISVDIHNSLLYDDDNQVLQDRNYLEKGRINEKRLKRQNYKPFDKIIFPTNENLEIKMKVKKGKRKKGRKNKYSLNKCTLSSIKTAKASNTIKSRKKKKSNPTQKKKFKPIYMPNFQGHSGLHIPPFFIGDNIITLSVTPCNDYYKKGKINLNWGDSNATEVNENKYFNIRGDGKDKVKSLFETQLKQPLLFRNKERTTTVSNKRKFVTSLAATTKLSELDNTLHEMPTDEIKVTTFPQKKIKSEKSQPEVTDEYEKKLKSLKDNTTKARVLAEEMKYSESVEKATHETPEHKFTIRLTFKPPKARNTNENKLYAYTVQPFTKKQIKIEDTEKNNTINHEEDDDTDYYDNEMEKIKYDMQLTTEPSTTQEFYFQTLTPVTDMEIRQFLVSPPSTLMKSPNNFFNLKELENLFNNTAFTIDLNTTPRFFMKTTPAEEFKETHEFFYEDFKEFKNDAVAKALKINVTKDEMRKSLKQTLDLPEQTEATEDYISNIDQKPENRVDNTKELNITKQEEVKQYDVVNEEFQQMTENDIVTEKSESEEDQTEMQYDDELESVMNTCGEKPKVASLFLPLNYTIPATETPALNESEDILNYQYGMSLTDSYQEVTSYGIMYSTETIEDQTEAEMNYQCQKEKTNKETSPGDMSMHMKEEEKVPNPVSEEQSNKQRQLTALPIIQLSSTNHDFEEGYKEGENTKEYEDKEKNESLKGGSVTVTKVQIYNPQPPTLPTTATEEEQEEAEDDKATGFQELFFWQNLTGKPNYGFQQPVIISAETKASNANFKNKTGNSSIDEDVKIMKQELKELKELLHRSKLLDKINSTPSISSTQSFNSGTKVRICDKIIENTTIYTENQEVDLNDSVEESQTTSAIENSTYNELKAFLRIGPMEVAKIENLESTNNLTLVSISNTDENKSYCEEIPTNQQDQLESDDNEELSLGENEVDKDNLNNPEMIKLDDSSETVNENSVDVDPSVEKVNTSIYETILNLKTSIIDLNNHIEPPSSSTVNESSFDVHNEGSVNNNKSNIQSAQKNKTKYSSNKAFKSIHFRHPKEKTRINLGRNRNSDVIILDNISNNPAEWVLHENTMWNIDPWGNLKPIRNKKVEIPSTKNYQKDKIVKDLTSKAALNVPATCHGRDSSKSNSSVIQGLTSKNFLHNPKLFVRLNNKQMHKTQNLLDQINRKCVKGPYYRSKYNSILNNGKIILLKPHFPSLKGDRYIFDRLKNSPLYIKTTSGLKEPKEQVKGGLGNNINLRKFYSPHKQSDKIYSSNKSKTQIKPLKKHSGNVRKKMDKQKINRTLAQPQRVTGRVNPTAATLNSVESHQPTDTSLTTLLPTDDQFETNLLTPGSCNTSKVSDNKTNLNNNQMLKSKVCSKKVGNLENQLWDKYDRWDRLDNLNKVEKLYDINMIKNNNQNIKKNMSTLGPNILDMRKNAINCSRKSNQKNLNFYKQRLNRKMTLLKNLQNKNNEAKITPEEEIKIKKILDGIVSRYKGRTNEIDEEDYFKLKAQFSAATRRNMTRLKTHTKFPKLMRFDKYRSKERIAPSNFTDSLLQNRLISIGRSKKLPYTRFYKKYKNAKHAFLRSNKKYATKINDKIPSEGYYVPQSKKINDQLLHRDKKNYVPEIPCIRTLPKNSSTEFVCINSQIKMVTNSTGPNFNREDNRIKEGDLKLFQKSGKLQTGVPMQGILSLIYPDNSLSNSSEAVNANDKAGASGCLLGSTVAGYSGALALTNNYHYNLNQYEDLLKLLENENINVTENTELKYRNLATIFKDNLKEIRKMKSRETVDDIKARLKAIDWLLNSKISPKLNRLQFKDNLPRTSCSEQERTPFDQSPSKDRDNDIKNMKKFITKYKTLIKMFEEQYGMMDIKDNMNQKLITNNKEDTLRDEITVVQKPISYNKRIKNREKNIRIDDGSNKKKNDKMYIFGQSKPRKDINKDVQDSEEQEIVRCLLDNDDDNWETCYDEIESYDDHQIDKIKVSDLAVGNMTSPLGNRTNPIIRDGPRPILSKYKTPLKYKSLHNGSFNKLFRNHLTPLRYTGEIPSDNIKTNWENWSIDKAFGSSKLQQNMEENHSNFTPEEKDYSAFNGNNNLLMLPIKFNTSDLIKLLNFKDANETDSLTQEDDEPNPMNRQNKQWDLNKRKSYIFDVDRGGPNGIRNRYYITFDSLSPNAVQVKNISTIPMSHISEFLNPNSGLNVMSIQKYMPPADKYISQLYINRNVKGNYKPELRSIEKVCLWLRKPLSYNITHQVPKVAISLGEVWPPMSEGQVPHNIKHYLVQVDPLVTPSKYPNTHTDYPSQISKVVWKAILHGFKTPKKTWQPSNQLG